MSTFVIESDAYGNFDSQYPIHLQGLVSPQEYSYIIQGATSILKKRRRIAITCVIFQWILMLLMFAAVFGAVWGIIRLGNVPFIFLSPIVILFIYVFVIVCSVFWVIQKNRRLLTQLRNFIESNNQQFFISRGVQFLVKTRTIYGYRRRTEHVYLEVIVNPNASGGSRGIQQPVIQQQPVYYHSNMEMEKSYSQKMQPFYYQ